jgi:hypothetical protein
MITRPRASAGKRFNLVGFRELRLGNTTMVGLFGPSSRDIRSQIAFHSLRSGADLYSAFAVQRNLEG